MRCEQAGVNMVMRNMALDLKTSEIAVMSVNPGARKTAAPAPSANRRP